MQMLTLRNIHWTIDLLWSWGLWCCWSTNHKSYCGGMWTWRTPQQCWLRGRQVHLGHRLGVLASLLVNIALKLHSEESKYTSASPRSTCFPPRATSTQVPLVQGQVHLGCASVNLALDSGDLSGVSGWAPRATSAQVPLVKSKFTSAVPRWTWPWLGELERSPPSSHPPTVGLILKMNSQNDDRDNSLTQWQFTYSTELPGSQEEGQPIEWKKNFPLLVCAFSCSSWNMFQKIFCRSLLCPQVLSSHRSMRQGELWNLDLREP